MSDTLIVIALIVLVVWAVGALILYLCKRLGLASDAGSFEIIFWPFYLIEVILD